MFDSPPANAQRPDADRPQRNGRSPAYTLTWGEPAIGRGAVDANAGGNVMAYTKAEIQAAFDNYVEAAQHGGATGDWSRWAACFTEDVHYIEHLYGDFHGRQIVLDWITATMREFPFNKMQLFPWDWYAIDEEQGFVIGQVQNRFVDPGDGGVYQEANWTRLVYAGNGLFSSEEDVYNPSRFSPMVEAWMAVWSAHHPD